MVCWGVKGQGRQPVSRRYGLEVEPCWGKRVPNRNKKYSPVSWSSVYCEVVWFKDREVDALTVKSDRPSVVTYDLLGPASFSLHRTALFPLTVIGIPYWPKLDLLRRERPGGVGQGEREREHTGTMMATYSRPR